MGLESCQVPAAHGYGAVSLRTWTQGQGLPLYLTFWDVGSCLEVTAQLRATDMCLLHTGFLCNTTEPVTTSPVWTGTGSSIINKVCFQCVVLQDRARSLARLFQQPWQGPRDDPVLLCPVTSWDPGDMRFAFWANHRTETPRPQVLNSLDATHQYQSHKEADTLLWYNIGNILETAQVPGQLIWIAHCMVSPGSSSQPHRVPDSPAQRTGVHPGSLCPSS
jgi:hypothetical protein